MAYVASLFVTNDAKVMLLTDPDTGSVLRNDKKQDMGLELTSTESEACKKVIAKFQNQHKKKQPSHAENKKFSIDLLVAACVGFVNLQVEEGKGVVDYSDEMAREIFERSPIIKKQVDEYLGNDANFLESVLAA